jgi:hypothetical protein
LSGVVVLVAAITGNKRLQLGIVLLAALAGTTLGLVGLAFGPYVAAHNAMPRLTDASDPLAHLAVGILAIWACATVKVKLAAA